MLQTTLTTHRIFWSKFDKRSFALSGTPKISSLAESASINCCCCVLAKLVIIPAEESLIPRGRGSIHWNLHPWTFYLDLPTRFGKLDELAVKPQLCSLSEHYISPLLLLPGGSTVPTCTPNPFWRSLSLTSATLRISSRLCFSSSSKCDAGPCWTSDNLIGHSWHRGTHTHTRTCCANLTKPHYTE